MRCISPKSLDSDKLILCFRVGFFSLSWGIQLIRGEAPRTERSVKTSENVISEELFHGLITDLAKVFMA